MFVEQRIGQGFKNEFDDLLNNSYCLPRVEIKKPVILKTGYLKKDSKERYFVLDNHSLFIKKSKSDKNGEENGKKISLSIIIEIIRNEEDRKYFSIKTESDTLNLHHEDEQIIDSWIQLLEFRTAIEKSTYKLLSVDYVRTEVKVKGRGALDTIKSKISNPIGKIFSKKGRDLKSFFDNKIEVNPDFFSSLVKSGKKGSNKKDKTNSEEEHEIKGNENFDNIDNDNNLSKSGTLTMKKSRQKNENDIQDLPALHRNETVDLSVKARSKTKLTIQGFFNQDKDTKDTTQENGLKLKKTNIIPRSG